MGGGILVSVVVFPMFMFLLAGAFPSTCTLLPFSCSFWFLELCRLLGLL